MKTPAGCKKKGSHITWGGVFCIILLVLIVIYFTVGIPIQVLKFVSVYQYFCSILLVINEE